MANFPTSKDDATSLPNPTGTNTQNNPDHAALHTAENAAIIAVESKVGTGSTVPAANQLLFGTGAGTSAWQGLTSAQLASVLSDETGSGAAVFATSPTLVTPKVDTINENTLNNGVTVGGVNLKAGAISTSSSVPTAALQDSSVTSAKVAPGAVVQVVALNTNTVATGTTIIPTDDTIPQNTEGDQYMSQAITPKASTNRLLIEANVIMSHSAAVNDLIAALFQDATANALAATLQTNPTALYLQNIYLRHDMPAGITSSTTFKVRAGSNSAGTTTFNGQSGARRFGGVTVSSMKITEYKA